MKQNTNIQPGFVVFSINNQAVRTKEDFDSLIKENKGGGILLQGKYEGSSGVQYYAFGY